MKGKFYFKESWFNAVKDLPEGLRREVYDSIITYAFTGTCTELKPMARIAFSAIKSDIDLDRETSAQFRELANKRWGKCDAYAVAYASESDAYAEKEEAPKEKVTPKEIPEEEKRKEKDIDKSISKKKFSKPTITDVADYCKERGNNVNATQFFNFYESKGWMVGKSPMKDWKAAVRTWEQKDRRTSYSNKPNKYEIPADVSEYQNQGGFYV